MYKKVISVNMFKIVLLKSMNNRNAPEEQISLPTNMMKYKFKTNLGMVINTRKELHEITLKG